MSSAGSFAFTAVVWVVSGAVIGWCYARRPWQEMTSPGVFTALRSWDQRHAYERVLRVRAWKDALPEAGTWFGGISKKRLPGADDGGLRRFAAESLRAERVHLAYTATVLTTLAWTRGWWMLVTVMFAVMVNVPCIVVARYNRVRLAHLA